MDQNKLYITTGVSGSGKSTIFKLLMDNELISTTTRLPRKGEEEGKTYYYVSEEEFKRMYDNNEFVQTSNYLGLGIGYGVTRKEYEEKMSRGNAFFICNYEGMKQITKIHSNYETIYMYCSKEDAEKHLRLRGESEEFIDDRLRGYEEETSILHHYKHVIINRSGEIEDTILCVKDIIGGFE